MYTYIFTIPSDKHFIPIRFKGRGEKILPLFCSPDIPIYSFLIATDAKSVSV